MSVITDKIGETKNLSVVSDEMHTTIPRRTVRAAGDCFFETTYSSMLSGFNRKS